ncbi:hypothetical protein L6452_05487 [Arctium lappa]|uniref:Uncharacterized protein n=1 Tax=Arctium lappa TaxID=4217 RepID=A0ACB9EFZ6_ARCLA|nr:hypothetical protein L6452_05487 [Arctium lappa]
MSITKKRWKKLLQLNIFQEKQTKRRKYLNKTRQTKLQEPSTKPQNRKSAVRLQHKNHPNPNQTMIHGKKKTK